MTKSKTKRQRHPLYQIWIDMRRRCFSKDCEAYKYYGARGISICTRWASFSNFLIDMEASWKRGLWIERLNNNGSYSPKNCAWKTPKEQGRNRRSNHRVSIFGERKCITQWCDDLGLSRNTVSWKMWKFGMSARRAILSTYKKTEGL